MNDFTKEELQDLIWAFEYIKGVPAWRNVEGFNDELQSKIQAMMDNYKDDCWCARKIARSHLREASSLINHAMVLLGIDDE